jgi:hypothetical protein
MTETTTDTNPNTTPLAELEHRASLLLTNIMDNPHSVGASVEDGNYSKVDTEYGTREQIEVGTENSRSETWLKISRAVEHDPKFHIPGKFVETMTAFTNIPGVAQVRMMIMDGKATYLEYSDPYARKSTDGLEEAIEAVKLAVEERRPLAS